MRRASTSIFAALGLAGCLVAASSDAQVGGPDPARRGLDLFLHLPAEGAPGGSIPLQIEAVGFPSVVSLRPLGGAAVEAAWDPESLGPGINVAPAAVRATTDSAGRAHLDVTIPDGDVRDLSLLVLERGFDEALRAALESLDPDRLRSPQALVDAVEAAARIERWAVGREGDGSTSASAPRRSAGARRVASRSTRPPRSRAGPRGSASPAGRPPTIAPAPRRPRAP